MLPLLNIQSTPADCVTPELLRIGAFVITDCGGTWPMFAPAVWVGFAVLLGVVLYKALGVAFGRD